MEIKAGKHYETKAGEVIGPVVWDDVVGVWRRNKDFVMNDGDYWHKDGSRYGHCESDEDLIAELY